MDMPQDPAAMQKQAAPARTICITEVGDGTYSVYEEAPEAMEAPGMPMEMGAMGGEQKESEGQSAASLDEALELARGLLSVDEGTPDEQVMAGYNRGKPAARAMMSPGKVFGE